MKKDFNIPKEELNRMAKFNWVKLRTLELGYKLKDLAQKSNYSYDYFIQVINGFKKPPKGFTESIESAFHRIVCELNNDRKKQNMCKIAKKNNKCDFMQSINNEIAVSLNFAKNCNDLHVVAVRHLKRLAGFIEKQAKCETNED